MKIFNEFEPTFSILFLGDIMSHNGIPDDFLKYILLKSFIKFFKAFRIYYTIFR